MNMNVCYVFDKGYIGQFKVSAYSLIVNNRNEAITVSMLTYQLGKEDREDIVAFLLKMGVSYKFYEIDETIFQNLPKMRSSSYATYYKLLIPSYLKDAERVLFLDCDIIVRKSIHDFYFMEMSEPISAIRDLLVEKALPGHVAKIVGDGNPYFNAGVMLFDFTKKVHPSLEKMIEYGITEFSSLRFHDQDILNHIYRDCGQYYVDDKYNYITNLNKIRKILFDRKRQVIIHYAGSKPWEATYKKKFYSLYVKYYRRCGEVTKVDFLQKRKPLIVLFFSYLSNKKQRA